MKDSMVSVKKLKKMLKKYKKKDTVILSIPCFDEESAEATLSVSPKNSNTKKTLMSLKREIW